MNTFGPQMAEIFESEIVKKYYATHERVDTTPVKSLLSLQVYMTESWNFARVLMTHSSACRNFRGKFCDGRVPTSGWFDMEWP